MSKIAIDSVIRYTKGKSALMKVLKWDDLCGYRTYHGPHLYGEWISVSDRNARKANAEEMKMWENHKGQRKCYTENLCRA